MTGLKRRIIPLKAYDNFIQSVLRFNSALETENKLENMFIGITNIWKQSFKKFLRGNKYKLVLCVTVFLDRTFQLFTLQGK
jgi:hypothetical protein